MRLFCVQQLCSSVIWESWCVKALLLAFHFRGGVTAQLTVCLFTRMSPAAMVTRFYQPPLAELCAIKAYSILWFLNPGAQTDPQEACRILSMYWPAAFAPAWCPSVPSTFDDKMLVALNVMVVFLTFTKGERHSAFSPSDLNLVFADTFDWNVAKASPALVRTFPEQIAWLSQQTVSCNIVLQKFTKPPVSLSNSLVYLFLNEIQWSASLLWFAECPPLYCLNSGSCIVGRHGPACT